MRVATPFLLLALLAPLSGCDLFGGESTSLFDPDRVSRPDPVVNEVVTTGPVVLAGIDEITIRGANFPSSADSVFVYFEGESGEVPETGVILSVNPAEIRLRVPNMPTADRLRVSTIGAENYSTAVPITLARAFVPFGDLDPRSGSLEGPSAVAGDGSGEVLVSISAGGSSGGVVRFTPDGVREPFMDPRNVWTDMALGGSMGDQVYATQNVQAIFTLPDARPVQPVLPNFRIRLAALTPDSDGRIWAAGSAGSASNPVTPQLHRFNLDGSVVSTDFPDTNVADLLVFGGDLYVAATRTSPAAEAKVWRLPILADGTLGAEQVVYDVAADQPGLRPSALAFAADGTLLVGIAPPTSDPRLPVEFPVIVVAPSGASSPLYPGVLPSPVSAMAWGAGSELYLVQSSIPPPEGEEGDPTPAALYRVETRLQGAP
ncbi:MAG: hypothetical protein AAGI52_13050 [Bacteroidota bacterium]